MSDQNPHPGDTHHSQSPVGCPTPPPPPPSGLTLIGALMVFNSFSHFHNLFNTVKPFYNGLWVQEQESGRRSGVASGGSGP